MSGRRSFDETIPRRVDCSRLVWLYQSYRVGPNLRIVYKAALILHRQKDEKCTRFWIEAYEEAEDSALTWTQFKQLVKKIGLGSFDTSNKDETQGTYTPYLVGWATRID